MHSVSRKKIKYYAVGCPIGYPMSHGCECLHARLYGALLDLMEVGEIGDVAVYIGEYELPIAGEIGLRREQRAFKPVNLRGSIVTIYLLHYGFKIKIGTSSPLAVASRVYSQAPLAALIVAAIRIEAPLVSEGLEGMITDALRGLGWELETRKPPADKYAVWLADNIERIDSSSLLEELYEIGEAVVDIVRKLRGRVYPTTLPSLALYYVNNEIKDIAGRLKGVKVERLPRYSLCYKRAVLSEKGGFVALQTESKTVVGYLDDLLYRYCVTISCRGV